MSPILKKMLSAVSGILSDKEDPYDQFRAEFESCLPADSLARDEDGNYLNPVTARKWSELCKARQDEVMAQW
ncbi:hypothetical protein ACM9HO_00650 [Pseudomonas sp. KHB2.9]